MYLFTRSFYFCFYLNYNFRISIEWCSLGLAVKILEFQFNSDDHCINAVHNEKRSIFLLVKQVCFNADSLNDMSVRLCEFCI